ncbi:MAG: hypothetical protein ACREH4_10610 [Vitreimonas sp.]
MLHLLSHALIPKALAIESVAAAAAFVARDAEFRILQIAVRILRKMKRRGT